MRKLDFRRVSLIGLAGSVLGSLTSVVLAIEGYGVWALVVSNLVSTAVTMVAVNVVAPFLRWPEFSLQGTRRLIVVGAQVTGARSLYFIYSQADVFIGGRIFGKDLLGFYSIALHLASLPVQKISSIVNQIAFPAFAEAQHDASAVTWHMLKGIRLLSFLSFPVLWGISSIAPEIVGGPARFEMGVRHRAAAIVAAGDAHHDTEPVPEHGVSRESARPTSYSRTP